jgi:organic radical activating enzyme
VSAPHKLRINEITYTLQGEGANTGLPVVLVRLSGCNLACSFCDTSHATVRCRLSAPELLARIQRLDRAHCRNILWTGGEPGLQLTSEHLFFFAKKGYWQAIETNGSISIPEPYSWLTCSPKFQMQGLAAQSRVDEWRLTGYAAYLKWAHLAVLGGSQPVYYSPIAAPGEDYGAAVKDAVEFVRKCPRLVRLSVQLHRLVGFK